MEILNSTYNALINLFDEREPELSSEKKKEKALRCIQEAGGLDYYVSILDNKLSDISPGARVKTPAKYFKSYEAAKIFQLTSIIEKHIDETTVHGYAYPFKAHDIEEMKSQLEELSEKYPEYVL